MSDTARKLAALLSVISDLSEMQVDPEESFLQSRGWIPLGKNSGTGLLGWGKMIDGHAVTVDQPEALAIERQQAKE